MSIFRGFIAAKFVPTIVLALGAAGVSLPLIVKVNGKPTSPWTADNPLVIGGLAIEMPSLGAMPPGTPPPGAMRSPLPAGVSPPPTANFPPPFPGQMPPGLPRDQQPSAAPDSACNMTQMQPPQRPPIEPANYEWLENQLKRELAQKFQGEINVKLDLIKVNPQMMSDQNLIESIRAKVENQEWDIAFTTIPIVSASALDQQYKFVARMFPHIPSMEYVLFSRKGSPFNSMKSIENPKTRIALGGQGSDVLFYFPIYDLYGLDLQVDLDNIPPQIVKKVCEGTVDVGIGLSVAFQQNPQFKQKFQIIGSSRSLPPAGVYLSPDQKQFYPILEDILFKIPPQNSDRPLYGKDENINYQGMLDIVKRTEEILRCLQDPLPPPGVQQRVRFFGCPTSQNPNLPEAPPGGIVGRVNGVVNVDDNRVNIKVDAIESSKTYNLIVLRNILEQDAGIPYKGSDLTGQYVHIADEVIFNPNNPQQLTIAAPGQLKVVKKPN
jgi:hypothetical protein